MSLLVLLSCLQLKKDNEAKAEEAERAGKAKEAVASEVGHLARVTVMSKKDVDLTDFTTTHHLQLQQALARAEQLEMDQAELQRLLTNAEATQRENDISHDLELRRLRFELEQQGRDLQAAKEEAQSTAVEFQKYKVGIVLPRDAIFLLLLNSSSPGFPPFLVRSACRMFCVMKSSGTRQKLRRKPHKVFSSRLVA